MSRTPDINVDDYVSIYEDVIDRKVRQLLLEYKNNSAMRWESYRNLAFKVKGFDNENLVILMDANGNEIHISKKALYLVEVNR